MLDACALWVFIRAFGVSLDFDALIIAFGIANVLAAIPITPGGLGYVDTGYVGMLRGFGVPFRTATLGVASYRFAQFFWGLLNQGVYIAPSQFEAAFVSIAHTEKDIETTISAVDRVLSNF